MEKNIIQVNTKVFLSFRNKVLNIKTILKKEYPHIKATNSLILNALIEFQEKNDTKDNMGVRKCILNLAKNPQHQNNNKNITKKK